MVTDAHAVQGLSGRCIERISLSSGPQTLFCTAESWQLVKRKPGPQLDLLDDLPPSVASHSALVWNVWKKPWNSLLNLAALWFTPPLCPAVQDIFVFLFLVTKAAMTFVPLGQNFRYVYALLAGLSQCQVQLTMSKQQNERKPIKIILIAALHFVDRYTVIYPKGN